MTINQELFDGLCHCPDRSPRSLSAIVKALDAIGIDASVATQLNAITAALLFMASLDDVKQFLPGAEAAAFMDARNLIHSASRKALECEGGRACQKIIKMSIDL